MSRTVEVIFPQQPIITLPGSTCPVDARTFLNEMGWQELLGEGWQKVGGRDNGTDFNTYSWEQALALEYMHFMTLGGVWKR